MTESTCTRCGHKYEQHIAILPDQFSPFGGTGYFQCTACDCPALTVTETKTLHIPEYVAGSVSAP